MHLASDCKLKFHICPSCKVTLESDTAAAQHMENDCTEVPIECDTCSKQFPRGKFREHICYVKYGNFRNVIELKQDVNAKLEEKNAQLEIEIQEHKDKAE